MRGAVVLLAVAACVHPADDRADGDELVGRAEAGEVAVEVSDGLASIQRLVPGELVLWAQAPAFTIKLRPGATVRWTVTVENVLPDAVLAGGRLDAQPRPTTRQWHVETGGREVTLALAPPDVEDGSRWRFAVMADVQEAIGRVQDIYRRLALDPTIRFVIMTGDLTERGTVAQHQRFRDELRGLPVPMYATPGNHDIAADDVTFHRTFGRGSQSFVFRGTRITFLDSASATIAPQVHAWLDGWMADPRLHVVLMHIPPLDPTGTRNGGFANRGEGFALAGKLARGGVDLTIYGHLHTFEAFENAGIPAYISGGGGAIPDRLDGIGRHFLTIDVDGAQFQVAVVRVD